MPTSRRVGLLGGTFDPPHVGHLVIAEGARVALALDEVQFVVAGEPWMKDTCSPAGQRVRMVELATAGNDRFHVNRSEIDRDGPTYTADTLEELRADDPEVVLFFLLGQDAAAHLLRWKRIETGLELATFVAVNRPGYEHVLDDDVAALVERLEVPGVDISSTELRRRFAAGEAVRYLTPDAVIEHVHREGLYDPAAGGP